MRVIIIEDEILAQARLEAMLKSIDPSIEVVAKLESVHDSRAFLTNAASPDVAFVDIQLSDDHSFEIFRDQLPSFPIIFITAYDQYLLDSFEYNAIDYVLKPITDEKLKRCLLKIRNLERHFVQRNLHNLIRGGRPLVDRMVVKKGTEFMALLHHEIAYFFSEHKMVFVRDFQNRNYFVDKTLIEVEKELDENLFFRLNRKFLTNIAAIEKFKPDNGRIRVFLKTGSTVETFISKETAPAFRKWIRATPKSRT